MIDFNQEGGDNISEEELMEMHALQIDICREAMLRVLSNIGDCHFWLTKDYVRKDMPSSPSA